MLDIKDILGEFLDLPKFDDGRINFKDSPRAPVFSCVLKYGEKILLLKRSNSVGTYKERWSFVTSYIDSLLPLDSLVYKELEEELGLTAEYIKSLTFSDSWHYEDEKTDRTWIIYPILATCKSEPVITLNWENTDLRWIYPYELLEHEIVPGIDSDLDTVFGNDHWRNKQNI